LCATVSLFIRLVVYPAADCLAAGCLPPSILPLTVLPLIILLLTVLPLAICLSILPLFTSLPSAHDLGGENPYIDTEDVLKLLNYGRLGR
jgi:hypothetical protein